MYAPIKHMRFNWETESHSFTFYTCGSKLEALDSLGDIIGSLRDLYNRISREEEHEFPTSYKVRGTLGTTSVEAKYD